MLLVAGQWLYEHQYLIPAERHLLDVCRAVVIDQEAKLVSTVDKAVPRSQRRRWMSQLAKPHELLVGISNLDWLKQSPRSRRGQGLSGAFERITFLHDLKVDEIVLPVTQTIGIACFKQMTLWQTTDEAIEAWIMRVSEIRRLAMDRALKSNVDVWQHRHTAMLEGVRTLLAGRGSGNELREQLEELVNHESLMVTQTRASKMRGQLIEMGVYLREDWRLNFISTFLNRDLREFGVNVPTQTLHRFWRMSANLHGQLFNASSMALGGISHFKVGRYLDSLVDTMMLRRLEPHFANVGKRSGNLKRLKLTELY